MASSRAMAQTRDLIKNTLRGIVLKRELPEQSGFKQCFFKSNGCKQTFLGSLDLKRHVSDCFYGIMQYCKAYFCKERYNEDNRLPGVFAHHAISRHQCEVIHGCELSNIYIIFYANFFRPNLNGYNLSVLKCFDFEVEGDNVRLVLGLVVQDLGLEFHRMMLLPLLYSLDHDGVVSHLVEMDCRIHGEGQEDILPVSYPGYESMDDESKAVVTSYGFKTTMDFISAADSLDGVVSYTSNDLETNGVKENVPRNALALYALLDVSLKSYRCIVKEYSEFPMVPWVLNWNELLLEEGVRETMSDGHMSRPSYLARILVPQIKGNADVMVESADGDGVNNAVSGAILDEIIKGGPRRDLPSRNVLALIIYPNVSTMRFYQSEWRKRADALDLDVLFVDSDYECLKRHLERFGCDIVLITPFLLYQLIRYADSYALDILTKEIRYVYFHEPYVYCDNLEVGSQLDFIMSKLPKKQDGIIRVAFVEYMSTEVEQMLTVASSQPINPTAEVLAPAPPIFDHGWNLITLGPDQNRLIKEMQEEVVPSPNLDTTIQIMLDIMKESGDAKRWVILHTPDFGGVEEVKTSMSDEFGWQNVVIATEEACVLCNASFWDPFLQYDNNTTVLIGPYFLLNFPEIRDCDGVIFYSPPPDESYRVRVSSFTKLDNNLRKPVISFECMPSSESGYE